ncbi:MAG: NADP-dependent oxidoreductase [Halobacteriaceae archaeon]
MADVPETTQRWVLARRPDGEPNPETDFSFEEVDTPDPGPGEVLVRTRYLSVDPYMRGRMDEGESYASPWEVSEPLHGDVVGDVVDSRSPDFEAGDVVVGHLDWAEYGVAPASGLRAVDPDRAPVSTALGVLGMPCRTAYFGTFDVADPGPSDTVVVSGAAGAVGSVAGQLASLAGARVVGVAGADRKCEWLTDVAGLDAAVNYEREDVGEALDDRCPDGVDAYFDNVGGPVTDAVFDRLNVRARVAVCGQISLYNATETPTAPRKLRHLIATRARVEGFLVDDFAPRFDEAERRLAEWVRGGDLAYEEHVVSGLERAPEAFLALFEGEKMGKQLVRVDGG